jgi:hypothetical protein
MRKLGLGLLCLAITGCITTHATLVDPTATRYPRVPPDSVRIFTDQSELDTLDFIRIAIIEASGSGEWTNQSEMLQAMRTKAGELGGNGVVLPRIEEPSAGAKVAAAIFGTGTQRKGNVVAVRVLGIKKKTPSELRGLLARLLR